MIKSILIVMTLTSCCSVPASIQLPLPPELTYPKIKGASLQCLTENTYERLNKRRLMCEARVETLKKIIKSTHP